MNKPSFKSPIQQIKFDPVSAIEMGLKEIKAHKFRSLLTMLGIILGVSSLIAMSALVKGMENGMREALIAIGGLEKVTIQQQEVPPEQEHLADRAVGITINDVYALSKNSDLVKLITPEMRLNRPVVSRAGKNYVPFQVVGTWPSALQMNQHEIQYGRMFNEIDDDQARSVCVIGTAVRDELFGDPEETGNEIIPIGEKININGQIFTIIGMFKHYESESARKARLLEKNKNQQKETQSGPSRSKGFGGRRREGFVFWLKNATVYMPLNTMWLRFRASAGTNNIPDPRLSNLTIKIGSVDILDNALQQTRNILMHTHKGIEDFGFRTQENWAENINVSIRNARLSGGIIAAISLIVGGIGIMNIMFASITERIREIGIRKAVGATTEAIFIQILVESLVIAVTGGIAGLICSFGLVDILKWLSPESNSPVITITAMCVAFSFSVAVGLIAGLAPAIKASKLSPLESLRYE